MKKILVTLLFLVLAVAVSHAQKYAVNGLKMNIEEIGSGSVTLASFPDSTEAKNDSTFIVLKQVTLDCDSIAYIIQYSATRTIIGTISDSVALHLRETPISPDNKYTVTAWASLDSIHYKAKTVVGNVVFVPAKAVAFNKPFRIPKLLIVNGNNAYDQTITYKVWAIKRWREQ